MARIIARKSRRSNDCARRHLALHSRPLRDVSHRTVCIAIAQHHRWHRTPRHELSLPLNDSRALIFFHVLPFRCTLHKHAALRVLRGTSVSVCMTARGSSIIHILTFSDILGVDSSYTVKRWLKVELRRSLRASRRVSPLSRIYLHLQRHFRMLFIT
jgi:hypothetical protein